MKYNAVLYCYLVLLLCYNTLLYKQYSAWVSCGHFIIMILHVPVLYYCIIPGTESCLYRRATRKSCTVQAQHRVRVA